jgi:hypothetical protein
MGINERRKSVVVERKEKLRSEARGDEGVRGNVVCMWSRCV